MQQSSLRSHFVVTFTSFVLLACAASAAPEALKPKLAASTDVQALRAHVASLPVEAAEHGILGVMIELSAPPTARVYSKALKTAGEQRAISLAKSHLASVEKQQSPVLKALEATPIGGHVLYSTQRTYNGIAAYVDAKHLHAIRRLPGVRAIHRLPIHTIENASSVPFLGAPEVWQSLGLDGEGVSIGIIDTGTDYLHTHFGGSGDPADYQAHATTPEAFFPTTKVVGGWDFAGDAYNPADPANNIPNPDPYPLDCNGHGTHVAGSAAGLGVNRDGSTYTGPYDSSIAFDSLLIGPGVAPRAEIWGLRIFGCSGGTALASLAIERALDPNQDGDLSDHLDIINMSFGSRFGSESDPTAVAASNAALAGVVVVASAGNNGDTYYITGSPGVTANALAVAATVDDGLSEALAIVTEPTAIAGAYLIGTATFGPTLDATGLTGEVGIALDTEDEEGPSATDGCSPIVNPDEVDGKIALIDRGGCSFVQKVLNAEIAGAIGVIVVNNRGDFAAGLGGSAPEITIPSVMIGQSNGGAIRSEVEASTAVVVTLGLFPAPDLADTVTSFTSRGPSRSGYVKPDISAPGLTILSALLGSADRLGVFPSNRSGTSMAAPQISGVMALLRQAHPDWSVEELKALAMNYSTADLFADRGQNGPVFSPSRVGSGRIDTRAATTQDVIAYSAENPQRVSVSFGVLDVVEPSLYSKSIYVVNKGASAASFDVGYEAASEVGGVTVSTNQSAISVPPGGRAEIVVELDVDPAAMLHSIDPTMAPFSNGLPRHWISEAAGRVVFTSDDGASLQVAVHATARPATPSWPLANNLVSGTSFMPFGGGPGVSTLEIAAPPEGVISLSSAFELQHISADDGSPFASAEAADLAYVGVTTDYRSVKALGGTLDDATLFFGIATHGDWATLNAIELAIWIDVDRDGTSDFRLLESNLGDVIQAGTDDVFITLLQNLNTGQISILDFVNGVPSAVADTRLFNTNVLFLPMPISALGLSGPNAKFDYYVTSSSRETLLSDITPTLTYNPARPGLDFTDIRNLSGDCPCPGPPVWGVAGGSGVPVQLNRGALRNNGSWGVLTLAHHNPSGERAQTLFHGRQLAKGTSKRVNDNKQGGFTYFLWDVPPGYTGSVTFTTTGAGELALYASVDHPPTAISYDVRSDHLGAAESVTLENVTPGSRVFVGIQAKAPYRGVTISAE